jgi:ADP-heptose:LPS heptosyltransferase/lauroyl/myristoyl acyltransferase
MSNLRHAFPRREIGWCKALCRENFFRLIELGMLGLAIGFLSEKRIKSSFRICEQYGSLLEEMGSNANGSIALLPHFTCMEAMIFFRKLAKSIPLPEIGNIYRPFANADLEKFILEAREKHGVKMIPRKSGFFEASKILKNGGIVSVMFDQHSGDDGYRVAFFRRVVSATGMPSMLYEKFKSGVYFVYPRRIGFWRANVVIKKLNFDKSDPKTILFAANKYLEGMLSRDKNTCADWLWAHNRWKIASNSAALLRGKRRRNWMAESQKYLQLADGIKNVSIMVRMPNWLGDIVMAIPILRMLKQARSDSDLIVVCKKQFAEFLNSLQIADAIISLPDKSFTYFAEFAPIRNLFPDIHISLVNSLRGDTEALLVNAPLRIGVDTKNKPYRKFFINNLHENSSDYSPIHQTKLWRDMLSKFGLTSEENLTPLKFCTNLSVMQKQKYAIGIVCGSANEPRKRWPAKLWRTLLERIFEKYSNVHVNLYGTKAEVTLCDEVALFFNRATISNLAGKTTLFTLASCMQHDNLIVAIDTGGMHFANMFGCPLVCLYGKTSHLVTGPVFSAPVTIVMPDGCPASGGFPTEDIEVNAVFRAVQSELDRKSSPLLCAKNFVLPASRSTTATQLNPALRQQRR